MKVHELKIHRPDFGLILGGLKRWELRRDDRGFQAGDLLWLREYDPSAEEYSDATQLVEVMRVSHDFYVWKGCHRDSSSWTSSAVSWLPAEPMGRKQQRRSDESYL